VPVSAAVPSPLSTKVTPLGKAPVSLRAAVGAAVEVTLKDPAAPTVKVVLLALVISGAKPLTVMATSPVLVNSPSKAVSLNTYMPGPRKVAVVVGEVGSANVTPPGPLIAVHPMVNAPGGFGSPSSVADPLNVALAGKVIV